MHVVVVDVLGRRGGIVFGAEAGESFFVQVPDEWEYTTHQDIESKVELLL